MTFLGVRLLSDIKRPTVSRSSRTSKRSTKTSTLKPINSNKILKNNYIYTSDSFSLAVHTKTLKLQTRDTYLRITLLILIVFLFLINIHFLLFLQIKENSNIIIGEKNESGQNKTLSYDHLMCVLDVGSFYSKFMRKTWFWMDMFIYFFIPFLTMSITFSIIKFKLKSVNKSYASILLSNTFNNYSKRFYLRKIKRNNKIIYFLFGTNVYFCLSITPYFLFSLFKNLISNLTIKETYYIESLLEILFYSNNAFNIFFYGFTSKQFRKALRRTFFLDNLKQKKKKTNGHDFINIFCKKNV